MGMKGWSEDEIETAKRMYAAGENCRSIGAAIGKHPDAVRYYIREHIQFFPEPQGKSYIPQGEKALYKRKSRYMRRCHDCGRPRQPTDARGAGHASGAEADTHPREMFQTWIRWRMGLRSESGVHDAGR